MRLFIAVDIPEEVKKELLKIQEEIKRLGKLNLIPKENIHITLKFLGEAKNSEEITNILETLEFEKFLLISNKIGFFPNENYISVMWLGFKEDEKLIELQKQIDEALSSHFKKGKDFVTHATIARVKHILFENKEKLVSLKNRELKSFKFEISSFKLMKSTPTPQGPVYETIKEFKAKGL